MIANIDVSKEIAAINKAWRNWPTLLANHYCFHLKLGVAFLFTANDSETNNSVCQAVFVSFATAMLTALKSSLKHSHKHVLRSLRLYGGQALRSLRHTSMIV